MTMPITEARQQPGARLLAVEDEPDILLAGLRYAGLEVATAAAGTEAMQRHRPDLIVLDVVLPGTDGSEVLQRLRTVGCLPGRPVW